MALLRLCAAFPHRRAFITRNPRVRGGPHPPAQQGRARRAEQYAAGADGAALGRDKAGSATIGALPGTRGTAALLERLDGGGSNGGVQDHAWEGIARPWAILLVIAGTVAGCTSTQGAYSQARRLDTLPAYQEYLKQNPSGPEAEAAKTRLAELDADEAFRQVEDQNTPAAYQNYAANHPASKYAEEAARRANASDAEALEWTVRIGSRSAYAGFAASYPESPYLPEVQERLHWLDTAKIAFAVEGVSEAELRAAFGPSGPEPRLVISPFGTPLDGQGVSVAMTMRKTRTTWREKPSSGFDTAMGVCVLVAVAGGSTPYILITGPVGLLCMAGVVAVAEASTGTIVAEDWEITIRQGDLGPAVRYYRAVSVATLAEAPGHRTVVAAIGEADLLVWLHTTPAFPAGIARAALRHPDGTVVAEVARALARRDPFPLEFFSATVNEAPAETRRATVVALGHDPRAVPLLIRVLATDTSANGEIRAAAAASLAVLGDRRAVDPLIRALGDPSPDVRYAATAALGDLGDRRAILPLITTLADRAASVQFTAYNALKRLTGEDFGTLTEWLAWWEQNQTNVPTR